MLARPRRPAHATVGAGDLDALVDRSLDGLFTLHLPSGGYDDPLAGPRFNYGAIGLAWLTGERAPAGPEGDARRAAAATTFRTGARTARPGAFQIWLEALALTEPSGAWLDAETRAALSAHSPRSRTRRSARARSHATPAGVLQQPQAGQRIASLQLTRTGLTSPSAHARLTDPRRPRRRRAPSWRCGCRARSGRSCGCAPVTSRSPTPRCCRTRRAIPSPTTRSRPRCWCAGCGCSAAMRP